MKFLLLIITSIWNIHAEAQRLFWVQGKVVDSTGMAIRGASISLKSINGTLFQISKADGSFSFRLLHTDSIWITVTSKGYSSFREKFYTDSAKPTLIIPSIVMKLLYQELSPVTVLRSKPVMIREDTTEFSANAFHVFNGAAVEDLLKRLPGVEVGMTGNVIFLGKNIGRARVDGKDFFGGDVLTAIRNLPADIVDKVQVIDDYGDKARLTGVKSGEPVQILNIIIKKDRRHGQFGQSEAGVGTKGKYTGTLSANAFNKEKQLSFDGGITNNSPQTADYSKSAAIHYADKWSKGLTSNGCIVYSTNDQTATNKILQDTRLVNGTMHQEQQNKEESVARNANFSFSLNHTPNPNLTLRLTPLLRIQNVEQSITSAFSNLEKNDSFSKSTDGHGLNKVENKLFQGGADLYFERILKHSKNRYSVQLNFQYSNGQHNEDITNSSIIRTDTLATTSSKRYLTNVGNINKTLNSIESFYIPSNRNSFFEFGHTLQYSFSRSDRATLQPINNTFEKVDSLSNLYDFLMMTNRFHIGYIASFGKTNLTAGIDVQPGYIRGHSGSKEGDEKYYYFNLLPIVEFSYAMSKNNRLTLQYNSTAQAPELRQLQPFTDLSNPQYPVTGNPALKPSLNQSVSVQYEQSFLEKKSVPSFSVGMSFTNIQNMVIANFLHPNDSSVVIERTAYLNANGFNTIQGRYQLTFPTAFSKKLRVLLGGSLARQHTVSMTDNILYSSVSLNWSQNIHVILDIPDILETDLSGNYSRTATNYNSGNTATSRSSTASWQFGDQIYIRGHWIFTQSLTQVFTNEGGLKLKTNPALVNAIVQKRFLKTNKASVTFTAYDIFNENNGVSQTVTPLSVTIQQSQFVGRYFLLSFSIRLQNFKE